MSLTNFLQKPLARALSGALASIASGGLWAGGTNWHYAQDTFDADGSPNKVLITTANASALGITNAQGGSVGMTVMSQTGVLTTLAVGAIPITYERGATQNYVAWSEDLTQSTWGKLVASVAGSVITYGSGSFPCVYTLAAVAATGKVVGYARLQAGSLRWCSLFVGASTGARVYVDLQSKALGTTTGAGGAAVAWKWLQSNLDGTVDVWVCVTGADTHRMSVEGVGGDGNGTCAGGTLTVLRTQVYDGDTIKAYLRTFATAPLYTAGTPRSQNLATGSGTQTITGLVSGCVYTVLHQAGGTYTLSGATTGTTTAGAATRFVASSTSLTLTASSAPTLLQVYEGTADLAYVAGPYNEYPQAGRYDDAVGSTNSIANSSMTGAAAGSPGTMPTGWTGTFTGSGLTQSIAATGTYLGAPYIDIRVQGTSPASQIYPQISFGAAVAASAAQLWTQSCYIGIVAGSLNGILNFFVAPADNNAGQTAKYFQPAVFVDRAQVTHTVAAGATTIQSILGLVTTGSSTAVDVTIRILAPQLEQRSVATPWIPTTNAAATRSPTLIRYPNSYLTDGPQTVTSCVVPASVATQPVLLGKATGASPSSAALYLASGGGAAGCFDGSTAVSTLNAASIGVPNVAAARWSGSTKSVRLNGGAIQSGSYTGTMPGTTVGSGDYGNTGGSNGFTGLRKWDKSAPRTFNDTDFQLAAAGG